MEAPAACTLILLMAGVTLAKFLRPTALQYWKIVGSGSWHDITEEGWWWSIATPVIVHSNISHFLSNAIWFFSYARLLESVVGSVPLVALFFGSHIVGCALRILINRIEDPEMYRFEGACGSSR
jgi:membrane associated rhomboid family serine protease